MVPNSTTIFTPCVYPLPNIYLFIYLFIYFEGVHICEWVLLVYEPIKKGPIPSERGPKKPLLDTLDLKPTRERPLTPTLVCVKGP